MKRAENGMIIDPVTLNKEAKVKDALKLMEEYKPRYFLHGHVHMNYDSDIPRRMKYGSTEVINAYERYIIDTDERQGE